MQVFRCPPPPHDERLKLNSPLVVQWLTAFLRDECSRRRKIDKAVIGLSGGVDSAVTAYLAAKAFGPENVYAIRLPYKISSSASLDHARLVSGALGIHETTFDITAMVDGYASLEPEITPARIGNLCARARMTILFDQAAKLGALPLGTGNKTERLFGYYTWHADDAPPINPLGDLYKTQVFQIARELGVPEEIVDKPPTADLIQGQTDEGDFGISYEKADQVLSYLIEGYSPRNLVSKGFTKEEVEIVDRRVRSTHWKRRLPTVAMLTSTAIGESYLRPVDF